MIIVVKVFFRMCFTKSERTFMTNKVCLETINASCNNSSKGHEVYETIAIYTIIPTWKLKKRYSRL